jgi:apolipoprotein N-acyltransferase
MAQPMRTLARLCWYLDSRRWALAAMNVVAAALFVMGCIGFFWPSLYVGSVVVFLVGSLLFLAAASGSALVEHGPCT